MAASVAKGTTGGGATTTAGSAATATNPGGGVGLADLWNGNPFMRLAANWLAFAGTVSRATFRTSAPA